MIDARRLPALAPLATFVTLAVAGLLYVKWAPYYDKAWTAAVQHSIGASILMGPAARAPEPSLGAAVAYALAYGKAVWKAMLLGLLLGSGIQAVLPQGLVARILGGGRFGAALAGGLLSLPAMMCTCCAAPVVAGLRRRSASPGGAIAFWLGNSVLNPATLVFIGFVLGWRWAALRLGVGAVMVFGLGYLANWLGGDDPPPAKQDAQATLAGPMVQLDAEPDGWASRWLRILGGMSLRLIPEYLVLVLLLGAARAWLFPAVGPAVDNHLVWVVALAAAGLLFVIPTAGEAPIIQAMLALGMGAGPAGALLLTLPPISLPSMVMLGRSFPARTLAMVAAGVMLAGVAAGGLAIAFRF